ncbi:hypothetical protein BJF79_04250 [Actinomadura sp. CNU-125]|nr:hypothetical protein BJF79_04250 [Actinomadura sp. CNU-125]
MRTRRTSLPEHLRREIEAETGPVLRVEPLSKGNHADIAATLHTSGGRVFVKAARKLVDRDSPEVMSLRREASANPFVCEFAPRLRWRVETGEWLALGFEYVDGRPADFSPGSPDLEALAKTVHAVQETPCPDAVRMSAERRWQRYADDTTPLAGDALLHTDLNEDNFIITPDGRAHVVDWAFVTRGAAWLELVLLIPWLLKAGHTPREADAWAARFPSWLHAPEADVDMFTAAFAEQWRTAAGSRDDDWVRLHAELTGRWAAYRLERSR